MRDFPLSYYSKIVFLYALIFLPETQSHAATLHPDPDNAALLYYQAYEKLPEHDRIESELLWPPRIENLYDVLCGGEFEPFADIQKRILELEEEIDKRNIDPNESITEESYFEEDFFTDANDYLSLLTFQELTELLDELKEQYSQITDSNPNKKIRRYLRNCQDSLDLAYAATEISKCDWGIRYSQGMQANIPDLSKAKQIMITIRLDVITQIADGNFMEAFQKSISLLKMARHFKNDFLIMQFISDNIAYLAFDSIRVVLEKSDPNENTLLCFKEQLEDIDSTLKINNKIIWNVFQQPFQSIRSHPEFFKNYINAYQLKDQLDDLLKNEPNLGNTNDLTNEEILNLAKKPFETYIDSAIKIMESNSPYPEKYSKIHDLRKEFQSRDYIYNDEAQNEEEQIKMLKLVMQPEKLLSYIISMVSIDASSVFTTYNLNLRCISYANATQAAIEIYLIHEITGQLPNELPEGLAKDPYSDKDFEYILNNDGFILRCREKDINAKKFFEYEYKVK